ncbi:2-oxo acid dehydrogenase subunit E2 [Candidatus Binatia bacterium]|nr:2-oxo acid dehydrogenase subunit E2 [Candidatus Binatia bacterium]
MTSAGPAAASGAHPILVPREIVNADSVYVVRWAVGDGTFTKQGTALCDIETSKAVMTLEAERDGYVRHCAVVGDEVAVGGVLGYLTAEANAPLPVADETARPAAGAPSSVRFSGKARQKIEELGLDLALFAGRGLVREQDVIDIAAAQRAGAATHQDLRGPFSLEPLGPIQRRVARVMEQSTTIPVSALERRVDLGPVRERARAMAQETKRVVSDVDLLVAAVAQACTAHPRFNAFVTPDYQLHLFEHVNVGVAVDVEGDLYVVVVRDAATKAPADIARELRGLQYLAQRRRVGVEQLSGGTITVTSMIGRGVHRFRPIPYPQQAAIVGIADLEPGTTYAALTLVFDHRVANGSQAAAFLGAIDAAMRG